MRTIITLFRMTLQFTIVISTRKLFAANKSTWIANFDTVNDVTIFTTEATCHFLLFAWLTNTRVTISLTFMFFTIQQFLTFFTTLIYQSILTAFHHSLTLSTLTSYHSSFMITRRAFSWMTSFRTRMSAIGTSFSATYFPTRVRQ